MPPGKDLTSLWRCEIILSTDGAKHEGRYQVKSYTVIYRTGGTENAKWHKTTPLFTYEDAVARKVTIERQGYKALIHDTDKLNRIGMPEGWEA